MISCPKGGTTDIPKGECDLLQQDCPSGDTCKPVSVAGPDGGVAWTTKCAPANGLKGISKTCAKDTECQPGLFCIFGACAPPCCPENSEPCNGGTCNVQQAYGDKFMMSCSFFQKCTLLASPSTCDMGTECVLQDPKQGLASCTPPSGMQVDEGGNCIFLNDCKENQFCYAPMAGAQAVCRWHCHPSDSPKMPPVAPGLGGCPAPETCMPFNFGPGITDIGLCLP